MPISPDELGKSNKQNELLIKKIVKHVDREIISISKQGDGQTGVSIHFKKTPFSIKNINKYVKEGIISKYEKVGWEVHITETTFGDRLFTHEDKMGMFEQFYLEMGKSNNIYDITLSLSKKENC